LWRAAIVVALAVGTLGACSDDGTNRTSPTTSQPRSSTTTTSEQTRTEPTPAALPDKDVTVRLEHVADANAPTAMATRAGTPNLYIAERAGRVRVLDPGSGRLGDPIIDISSDVSTNGERGLLGITFSPDGGRLYLSSTDRGGDNRLDEYVMSGDVVDLVTKRTLFSIEHPASNHNGGDITFGPDGMLWYGLGDGGGGGDQYGNAQNVNTLLGSILRIDVNGRGAGEYSIPPDNPFANGAGRPEIWLYGVRNPWRFSFDRETSDLWIGDVGQDKAEEIDLLRAPDRGRGANLQWPLREGFERYKGDAPAGSVDPIFEYGRADGSCSIIGGYVYRGAAIASLRGAYLFGDYCEGTIRALFTDNEQVVERSLGANADRGNLASFGQDQDGELWTLSLDGTVARIVAA
jgi:glucose/arabinose dehydrogenase